MYLVIVLLLAYSVVPCGIALVLGTASNFVDLAVLSALGAASVWVGAQISLFDPLIQGRRPRLVVPPGVFSAAVWCLFVTFAVVALATAERIPLVAALGGADADTIAVLREEFLKAREGWQSSFVYINAGLSGALIPYSIALMFRLRMPGRWFAFAVFLAFCISFVEKAFFLKAALPLLYLVAQRRIRVPLSPAALMGSILGLLILVTIFSGAGTAEDSNDEAFFSVAYAPHGPLGHILWRSVAIPVVTAADAIRVLHDEFGGQPLWGATSSLLAGITGREHIEFERMVFSAQWGQNETGTGSSNSVFLTEAYVNFGWPGVVLFSVLVGWLMRVFAKSRDEALRSLWILFAFGVYTSGLIGLLLSNGFILLFGLGLFVRFKAPRIASRPAGSEPGHSLLPQALP
jgi:hypothetical protein